MLGFIRDMPPFRRVMMALLAVGICLGVYGCLIEPFRVKVTEWTVRTDKWTNGRELRIALIGDTHAIWPWMTAAHLERIVKKTNALSPDLILLLGDYVATHPFGRQLAPQEGIKPFEKLSAPCGVYAVLGNHDFFRAGRGWIQVFNETTIPVLDNRAVHASCPDYDFWIAGLTYHWWEEAEIRKVYSNVPPGAPVIMAVHNPDAFAHMPDNVTLTAASHTHGGQIRIPFIGAVEAVIPSQYGLRYLYGHISEGGKDLVVSAGLGMSNIPVRFMMPPEITLVTLKRATPPTMTAQR